MIRTLGDPLPIQVLRQNRELSIDQQPWTEADKQKLKDLDLAAWQRRHDHARISRLLDGLITELRVRDEGTPLLAVGYCFGGKHALRLAKSTWKAAAAFHPSFVEAEDMTGITAPLYIGLAENDTMVPASLPSDLRRWADVGLYENTPFSIEIYPGMAHGFAARPDSFDKTIKTQYEKAFRRAVEHFRSHT